METVAKRREVEFFWLYRKLSSSPVDIRKKIFLRTGSRPISGAINGRKSTLRQCHFYTLDDVFNMYYGVHRIDRLQKLQPK